jgi:hypothetical protein
METDLMEHATQVLRAHPQKPHQSLEECLKACFDCEAACTACADACLHEKPDMLGKLVKCIGLGLDCADVCGTTGRLMARAGGADPSVTRAQLQACIAACRACEAECQKHASMHEHCKHCAEACHASAQACETAMRGLKAA